MSSQRLVSNRSHVSGEELLQFPTQNIDATLLEKEHVRDQDAVVHIFPTGHKININLDGQSVSVEDIHGDLQVAINITDNGPQIRLTGGQLDLHSPENIGLDCNAFRLRTKENTEIIAQGQVTIDSTEPMRFTSADDVYVRGRVIWLN